MRTATRRCVHTSKGNVWGRSTCVRPTGYNQYSFKIMIHIRILHMHVCLFIFVKLRSLLIICYEAPPKM